MGSIKNRKRQRSAAVQGAGVSRAKNFAKIDAKIFLHFACH
jgi:hypothetical protein